MSREKAIEELKKVIGCWVDRDVANSTYLSAMKAIELLESESQQPPAGEFTKKWTEARTAFKELKPKDDTDLDYFSEVHTHIHNMLKMGDEACKRIDRLEADLATKNTLLKELSSQTRPCSPSCYHHQTHPCEKCGRIYGYLPKVWQNQQMEAELKAKDEVIKQKQEVINSIAGCIVTQPKDFSLDHRDAWMYWILFDWGDAEDEILEKHKWDSDEVKRLKRLRKQALKGKDDEV